MDLKKNIPFYRHPIYRAWDNMRQRCKNPKHTSYIWYGEKGIKVCPEWDNSFDEFLKWSLENNWREGLSIDRIDSSKDYAPSNCQWVSRSINSKKSASKARNKLRNKFTLSSLKEMHQMMTQDDLKENIIKKFNLRTHELSKIMKSVRWKILDNSIKKEEIINPCSAQFGGL